MVYPLHVSLQVTGEEGDRAICIWAVCRLGVGGVGRVNHTTKQYLSDSMWITLCVCIHLLFMSRRFKKARRRSMKLIAVVASGLGSENGVQQKETTYFTLCAVIVNESF